MTGAVHRAVSGPLWGAIALGSWAAAIALAPAFASKVALVLPAVALPLAWWVLQAPTRWIAGFFATALLLPPLPLALGDSGPHVCLLFAGLGLLAGLLSLPAWRVPWSEVNGALVALFVVLLASVAPAAIYSGAVVASASLARVALFGIPVYVFFYTAYGPGAESGSRGALRWLYWMATASALFACVDFYFQFPAPAGYGAEFVWLESGVYRRAQGVFYEAGVLGNLCAFFLVMIAVALVMPGARAFVSRRALAAGGAVLFAALLLSYSRSSLVNVLTGVAVLGWLHRKRLRLPRMVALLIAGGAGAALLTGRLFPQFLTAYWLRLSATAEFFFSATEDVLSGRMASWDTLRNWIAAHPWQALAGIGYKTLPYTNYLGAPVVGDNMYLSLLVETGILGLAALVWLHIAILRAGYRAASTPDPQKAFLGTCILCFWCGQIVQMFSVDLLTFWRVLPVYFWVLALAVRP